MNNAETGSNFTPPCPGDPSTGQTGSHYQVIGYCLMVIPLSAAILNFTQIVFVSTAPKLKSHTRVFLISLAFCDILKGLVAMPFRIIQMVDFAHLIGETGCDVGNSLDLMLLAISVLHMCALALDRCVASVRPFQLGLWFGRKYGSLIFATCWVLPAILIFGFNFPKFHPFVFRYKCKLEVTGVCRFLPTIYYSILFTAFSFFIPSLIISACYRIIIKAVSRRQQMFLKLSNLHTKRGSFNRRYFGTALSKTILKMTSYSVIFWLPFFTIFVVDPFTSYRVPRFVWVVVTWLRLLHAAVNPLLYMKGTKILTFNAFSFS